MNFGIYSYTVTIVVFVGFALLLYFFSGSRIEPRDWKIVWRVILLNILLTIPGEGLLLKWKVYLYDAQKTLHVTFLGPEIETYFYIAGVALVIALATIIYARREDEKSPGGK